MNRHGRDLDVGAHIRLRDFGYRDDAPAYHVIICAERPARPFTDPELAQVVIDSLHWLRQNRHVAIYAYCLMPDHLHFLMRLTQSDWTLSEIVGSFKSYTSREARRLGHSPYLWQRRFYDHILRRSEDGGAIAAYILRNPERAGLVEPTEQYPYCGMPDPL